MVTRGVYRGYLAGVSSTQAPQEADSDEILFLGMFRTVELAKEALAKWALEWINTIVITGMEGHAWSELGDWNAPELPSIIRGLRKHYHKKAWGSVLEMWGRLVKAAKMKWEVFVRKVGDYLHSEPPLPSGKVIVENARGLYSGVARGYESRVNLSS